MCVFTENKKAKIDPKALSRPSYSYSQYGGFFSRKSGGISCHSNVHRRAFSDVLREEICTKKPPHTPTQFPGVTGFVAELQPFGTIYGGNQPHGSRLVLSLYIYVSKHTNVQNTSI
jgi:hypothetical protein